jgi:hypothetical protein
MNNQLIMEKLGLRLISSNFSPNIVPQYCAVSSINSVLSTVSQHAHYT